MNLFYTPEYAKTGDVIPFYNQKTKRFENYYLKNWNPDAPKDKIVYGWHQIITEDNRIYKETPTNIQGGTGSVIEVDGVYHMFYCTFDQNPPPSGQDMRRAKTLYTGRTSRKINLDRTEKFTGCLTGEILMYSGMRRKRNGG